MKTGRGGGIVSDLDLVDAALRRACRRSQRAGETAASSTRPSPHRHARSAPPAPDARVPREPRDRRRSELQSPAIGVVVHPRRRRRDRRACLTRRLRCRVHQVMTAEAATIATRKTPLRDVAHPAHRPRHLRAYLSSTATAACSGWSPRPTCALWRHGPARKARLAQPSARRRYSPGTAGASMTSPGGSSNHASTARSPTPPP